MLIKSVYFPSIDFKHCRRHYIGLTQQTVDTLFFRKATGIHELSLAFTFTLAFTFFFTLHWLLHFFESLAFTFA